MRNSFGLIMRTDKQTDGITPTPTPTPTQTRMIAILTSVRVSDLIRLTRRHVRSTIASHDRLDRMVRLFTVAVAACLVR